MRHRRRSLAGVLLAAALLSLPWSAAPVTAATPAEQLRPIDLRVEGGEATWHPDNYFRLDWERPPAAAELPIVAVLFRLRDGSGAVVRPTERLAPELTQIEHVHVPDKPGLYLADVQLEGPGGARGPWESAELRFDDGRPAAVGAIATAAWFGAEASPTLRLGHPAAPLPVSGIRGYAVSVDRGEISAPCAGPRTCTPAETDLDGGIGDDTLALGTLPQGTHVVRAVAVSGSGMRSANAIETEVRVDAGLPEVILRTPPGWADGPVAVAASARDVLSGMVAAGAGGPFTAISIDGGLAKTAAGGSVTAVVTGEGTHRLDFFARDAAGNVGNGTPGSAALRIDETPPALAFSGAQDVSEPERIEVRLADRLSGPDPARGIVATRPNGSRQPFEPLPTRAVGDRLIAHWNSEAFAPGTYEFRATGFDRAGNVASTVRREDGARMVLANPLKAAVAIEAAFGGRRLVWHRCRHTDRGRRCRREAVEAFGARPRTREVPFGRAIPYGGRLVSASGAALAGLPVQVIETFAPGAEPGQRVTTVQTAADGSFRLDLQPGPSRRIEVAFAASPTLTRSSSAPSSLGVQTAIRLRASATSARVGGAPVIFRGRLGDLGAPTPRTGRPVQLQFRLPGGRWSEFRTVQTDADGRFRYPYAFSDDDSRGVRFQFRAFAPAQPDWPYEPAASRPVFVTGR